MAEVSLDESESEEYDVYFKPSYVLIAVDTHETMFKAEGQPSPFKNCLKALYRIADVLLMKPNKGYSPFCVVLFDKESRLIVNFKDNMIQTAKFLRGESNLSEEETKRKYMRSGDASFTEFLQFCKKKFKEAGQFFYKRKIFFISNDPDPVKNDASIKFTSRKEFETFTENEISFELIVTEDEFNYDSFYNELFTLTNTDQYNILCEDEEGLFQKLITMILYRLSQRKLCFYPFKDDLTKYLTVIRKSYLKKDKILNNSFMAEDGTRVIKKQIAPEEDVTDFDAKYVLHDNCTNKNFDNITFDVHEKLRIDNVNVDFKVGLTLLYVCHRLSDLGEILDEPKIIEEDASENLPFFREFWQYCVDEKKVLVCARVLKSGFYPRAVELIPKFINNNRVFLEMTIPHSDEKFEPPKEKIEETILTDQQKEVTEQLIQKLAYDFQTSFLVDKEHLRKMNYIKAKLLDEDRQEIEVEELLTAEEMDERLNVEEFLECFPPSQGVKRKK